MTATLQDIQRWLESAKEKGASHLIVAVDTYNYDNYPVYVGHNEKIEDEIKRVQSQRMQGIDDKHYYYFSKCGHCYAKGYLDWVEYVRGRKPGIGGIFFDDHPAGSCMIAPEKFGGCKVYDGHKYISANTERGEALWNELVAEKD